MTSSSSLILFPPSTRIRHSTTSLASVASINKASALDVHHVLYSITPGGPPSASGTGIQGLQGPFPALDNNSDMVKLSLDAFYERDAVYENPVVTAPSRAAIVAIFALGRLFLDGRLPPGWVWTHPPFRMHLYHAWSEVMEVSESESFDRSRKVYLEHVLHVVLLPDLHTFTALAASSESLHPIGVSEDSFPSSNPGILHGHPVSPQLAIPFLSFTIPSPFHFRLRFTSRFSFNDVGKITYHRDMWDVKDIVHCLVPGSRPVLWILSRIGGLLLAMLARLVFRFLYLGMKSNKGKAEDNPYELGRDISALERAPSPAYAASGRRARRSNSTTVDIP